MSRERARITVLENVARLERENTELRARVEQARAHETLEDTIQTRAPKQRPSKMKVAAAVSFGLTFGLVTLALTMLLMPPVPGGHPAHDAARGGSAGVCR